ncbi:MAG: TnpV protein [Faecalibacterium prausnitzii]
MEQSAEETGYGRPCRSCWSRIRLRTKRQHQMEWVQHMNSLNAQAEELVMNRLIYS